MQNADAALKGRSWRLVLRQFRTAGFAPLVVRDLDAYLDAYLDARTVEPINPQSLRR
jgi:hypothetical protein